MVVIRKSAGVGKMRIGTSDLLCALIHHINKRLLCAADMFRNLCGNIIGRLDNQCIQTILHGKNLSHLRTDIAGIRIYVTHSGFCKGHLLVHGGILYCHQQCHNLGNTCRISLLIRTFVVKNHSGICIHQNTGI